MVQQKEKCNGFDRKKDRCKNYVIDDTNFCRYHQYMEDYTDEQLDPEKLIICSCCKMVYYPLDSNLTCSKCRLRIEKDNDNIKKDKCKCKCIDRNKNRCRSYTEDK